MKKRTTGSATAVLMVSAGLVYAGDEWPELWAVRPGGRGDVSQTHVAWKFNGAVAVGDLRRTLQSMPQAVWYPLLRARLDWLGLATCRAVDPSA